MRRSEAPRPLPGSEKVGPATEIWGDAGWRRDATQWIDASLERRGLERVPTTPLQPRLRPWSTLLVVDTTSAGRAWFKASVPEMTPEAQVLRALRSVSPDAVPDVWAADSDSAWLLMPDQGSTLKDTETSGNAVSLLSAVLRRYARVQRASVAVVDDLRAAGVPFWSPREVSKEWTSLHLRPDTSREMRLAAMRLEDIGMPMTVQHADLHSGNVFADGTMSGVNESRIFDWADSSIGHPLCSLLTPLRRATVGLGVEDARSVRDRLVRAYLSSWSDVLSTSAMTQALDDALLVARAANVLNWRRALSRATDEERHQWAGYGRRDIREINGILLPEGG